MATERREPSVSHKVLTRSILGFNAASETLVPQGGGPACVIQDTDCSIIGLVAIFDLVESIIELAKLTTICRLGFVLDVDLDMF